MLFYFTGTGNSLYVAKQLEEEIISIPQAMRQENLTFYAEQIGIVCPINGHEMPAMVKEFIEKATFHAHYLYAVLTYGAMHGGAAQIANQYFESIGKKADYINTIVMVDNFLPHFDMAEQCSMNKEVEKHLEIIKCDIHEKKQYIQKASVKDRAVHKMFTAMVAKQTNPIKFEYRITEDCIGCGICMKVCPANCIHIENQKANHTMEHCQACMACIHACPKMAVQFFIKEANPKARYRNEHITLSELVEANNQTNS